MFARKGGVELIAFGAQIGRDDYNYRNAFTKLIRRFIEEAFYVGLPFYVLYSNKSLGSILNPHIFPIYVSTYLILWILLQTLYDAFYALNDCVFAKYEEKPSFRGYCQNISLKRLLLFRLIYICVLMYLSIHFFCIKLENLVIAVALITYALFLHNLTKVNLWRIFTFSAVRLSRWAFIPIAMGASHVIPQLMIILIPYLLLIVINGYNYELQKYGVLIPLNQPPFWLVFSAFIPFAVLLLYPDNLLALLPICITIFVSIYRRVIRTRLK
jgi:hypothetical protein